VIEVRLCNRFGSQSVHENLDLDLYKGEILAVVGGSGSGKWCCAALSACAGPARAT
jgi:phospholipid/cholesterol/gamma-HCH transport system ATP-binding protein